MIRRNDVNNRPQASLKHISDENSADVLRGTFHGAKSRPDVVEKAASNIQMNQREGNSTLRKIPQLPSKAKKNTAKAKIVPEGVIDPCRSHNAKHSAMPSKVPILSSRLSNLSKGTSTPVLNKNTACKGNKKSTISFHINPNETGLDKVAKRSFAENKYGSKKKTSHLQSTAVGKFSSFSNLYKNPKIDKNYLLEEVVQPKKSSLKRVTQSGMARNSFTISGRDNDRHVHNALALSSGKKVKFADSSKDNLNENSEQDVVDTQASKSIVRNNEFDVAEFNTKEASGDIKQENALKMKEITKESEKYFPIQKLSIPPSLIEDIKRTSESKSDIDQFQFMDKKYLETSQSEKVVPKNLVADTTRLVSTELLKEHKKYSIYTTMFENTPSPPKEVSSFPGLNLNFSPDDDFDDSKKITVKCVNKETAELFQTKKEISGNTSNFAYSPINHWKNYKKSPVKCIAKETTELFGTKNEISDGSSSIVYSDINNWKIPTKKTVDCISKKIADISNAKYPSRKSTTSSSTCAAPEVPIGKYSEYIRMSKRPPKPSKIPSPVPKSNITLSPMKKKYDSFPCSYKEVPEVFQKSNLTPEKMYDSNFIYKLPDAETGGKTQCTGVTQKLEITSNNPRQVSSSPNLNASVSPINRERGLLENNYLDYGNNKSFDTLQDRNTTSKIVVSNIPKHTLPEVTVDEHKSVTEYSRMVERTSQKVFTFPEPTLTSTPIEKNKEEISQYARILQHTPKTSKKLSSISKVNTTFSHAESGEYSGKTRIPEQMTSTPTRLSSVPKVIKTSAPAEEKGEFSESTRGLEETPNTFRKISSISKLNTNSAFAERNGEFSGNSSVPKHTSNIFMKDSSDLKVHIVSSSSAKKGTFSENARMTVHTPLKEFLPVSQLLNTFSPVENGELFESASILEHIPNTPKRLSSVLKLNIPPSPAEKKERFADHGRLMQHTHNTHKNITSTPTLNRNTASVENKFKLSENKSVKSIREEISQAILANNEFSKNISDLNATDSAPKVSMQSEITSKVAMHNNEGCPKPTKLYSIMEFPQFQVKREVPPKTESIESEINEKIKLLKSKFLKEIKENKRSKPHKTGKKRGILKKYYDEQMSKTLNISMSEDITQPTDRNIKDLRKLLKDDMDELRDTFKTGVPEGTKKYNKTMNVTPTISRIPRYKNTSMSPKYKPVLSRKSAQCGAGAERDSQSRENGRKKGANEYLLNCETPKILRLIEDSRRNASADNVRTDGEELTHNVRYYEQNDEKYKELFETDYYNLHSCTPEVHKSTAHSKKLKSSEYLDNVNSTAICSSHDGREFVQFENSSTESVNTGVDEERGRRKCSCFNVACACRTERDDLKSSKNERSEIYRQRKANAKAVVGRDVNDISIYRKLAISIFLFLMFSGLFIKFVFV